MIPDPRELSRGERHRRVLRARTRAVQARLHPHPTRPLPTARGKPASAPNEALIARDDGGALLKPISERTDGLGPRRTAHERTPTLGYGLPSAGR